jgi:AcrR family transcriptional regulator
MAGETTQIRKAATPRFAQRQEAVLAAAIAVLNGAGLKGMTLADVAARIGLTTTSVTYYFKKKDDLAAACFHLGLERFGAMIDRAAEAPDLAGRLDSLLGQWLAMEARVRQGREPPLTIFSDIRALAEPQRGQVVEAFQGLFRKARDLFKAPGCERLTTLDRSTRAHMLMEQVFWSVAWLPRYDIEDFPRIQARMFDILAHGLAPAGAAWAPRELEIEDPGLAESARDTFLRAATPLINARGFRGVSVDEIAARLNVTKGSFYHHMDAKDDVVAACFERTFAVMRAAQLAGLALKADQWTRLSSAVAALVARQVTEEGLLLRTSALQALPEQLRNQTVWRADRVSQRFASMIADGAAEGSIRPVDPFIAAQMVSAAINAAADLIRWEGVQPEAAIEHYARPALTGLLAP